MKKYGRLFLMIFVLMACMFLACVGVNAAQKTGESRAIAIVFDNSGSMYYDGDQAWCRATYAMEVFGSMLNTGDTLLIYPMHPVTVDGKEYTMEAPLRVTAAAQAAAIRNIYTPKAGGTPIESVDCAVRGLQATQADKKYMIVLTDGEAFYRNGREMSAAETRRQLDTRFQAHMGDAMTVMYLGIGSSVVMPDTEQSVYFAKKQAKNSEDVLSALTEMCNQIFGRDTLPKSHFSGTTINFDISMNKLIVFVQGENVANLKVTGASGLAGKQLSVSSTKYGTAGCGNYDAVPDTSLQGMMVTYADCAAGSYTINYTGTATSIEVYYEPDADLDFVFTDAAGNTVDSAALYEGDYKVSFGMKDAKTGKLISSDLLGEPHYYGSYSVNGEAHAIAYDGQSGETPVTLGMNDAFDAKLTVTYLSGYTISKDSTDFGWPSGGIRISARPAGELRLEISGGQALYSLQNLEEGTPYEARVFYKGTQLTGAVLESVDLKWEPETSNAEIKKEFADDHYNLYLHYKDPDAPQDTVCGVCTVTIYAFYAEKGSDEAQAQTSLTYNVEDDFSPLSVELSAPDDYIVISKLKDSRAVTASLKINGEPLSARDFAAVDLQVDCGSIAYTLTANEQASAYSIQLLPTDGIRKGNYPIRVTAAYTDHIGRVTQIDDTITVTLSNVPLWVKWTVGLLILALLIALIVAILHIKVLPQHAHVNKKDCVFYFDGENESTSTAFQSKIEKGRMEVFSKYAGTKVGLTMDVKPGKESYLKKPQIRRSADANSASVRKFGSATIQEASIGSAKFVLNEETGKLERMPKSEKPIQLKHGMPIRFSGIMLNAGTSKPFTVTTKLNFKKK